jgi:hypothetical protein
MLMGMVAAGSSLIDVIVEKSTGDYRRLPFSRWLMGTRGPLPPRLPQLEKRWWDSTNELAKLLDPSL